MTIPSEPPAIGATVWLTGLPSAGKTTLAGALHARLTATGRAAEILDGDAVRPILSPELGYSRADRDANVARIGWVASRLARDGVRSLHEREDVRFLEVHVATPVAVCAERDVKGLYAKARGGGIQNLTGIDGEYEPPVSPELRLDTAGRPVEDTVEELIAMLEKENLL